MRVIFFGTPFFAASILDHLIQNNVPIVAVVSQEDKPQKRSKEAVFTPVKQVALQHNIPLMQPKKVSDPLFIEEIKKLNPDLFLVVAFGQIFPQALLDVPKVASLNVHTSLLPLYRGAAPMQRSLMDGVKKTGVTIQHMAKKMDAGDIVLQEELQVPHEMNLSQLHNALLEMSKKLLLEAYLQIKENRATKRVQDETKVTFAPKIEKQDLILDFNNPYEKVTNHIRALSEIPGAYTHLKIKEEVKRLKIFSSKVSDKKCPPAHILIEGDQLFIGTQTNALEITELQLEGKDKMSAKEFLRGFSKTLFSQNQNHVF